MISASGSPAAAGSGDLEHRASGKFNAAAAIASAYPCNTPFGSVLIPGSAWAGGLTSTGHDGATFDVYSNYRPGRSPSACAGDWVQADGTNQWGLQFQCTELAVRVADGEWATGNYAAWTNAGWNGAADSMSVPGQRLGLTWTGNGTGSLPVPGDLMIWSSGGGGDPGHVAVVSAVGNAAVTFVGENQGDGMVTLPVSGTTVENNGWKSGSSILGWLSHPATANGSFVQVSGNPAIYEIAGGAPLYVSSWDAFGGPQPYTVISQSLFDALNPVPVNGTMIRSAQTGAIYMVAGGAPLYMSSCGDFGGCAGVVNVDQWAIGNAGAALSHLNRVPVNGTMIRSAQTGAIYMVAGGAPLYMSGCADFGGCAGLVNVDQWAIGNAGAPSSHLRWVPANGTFLRSGARGTFYRVAGGYPFKLTNCKVIGGCKHPVIVDPWDLTHLRNPLTHLRSTPRNGTIVRCYPSRKYWSFKNGIRHHSSPSKRATAVDDSSVTHFPL